MKLTEIQKFRELVQGTTLAKEIDFLLNAIKNSAVTVLEEIFLKTSTVVSGSIPQEGILISELIEKFKEAARKRGITNIWIDNDIIGWFGDYTANVSETKPSRLVRFLKTISHKTIINTSKQSNVYREYDLGDAISRATALVDAGELDETDNTRVVIYLQKRKNGSLYRLGVWRYDDGKLVLDVYKVNLDYKYDEGGGTLVSNDLED